MLRPLLAQNSSINLIFDDVSALPALHTDEGKVSQILRNFISNALKYTERGDVRISASPAPEGRILFSVEDQGIGIAPEHLQQIFEEFHQIEGPLQKMHKGTGLGLPLSKKLAELLGGVVRVKSRVASGPPFRWKSRPSTEDPRRSCCSRSLRRDPTFSRIPVLVVEDNRETLFVYEKYLKGSGFQPLPAPNLADARRALASYHPAAIVLDLLLEYENAWGFLGS
jgi:signal transduction histidine kinase